MKVIFITTVAPYPKNVGKKIVLGGICDFLSASSDVSETKYLSFEMFGTEGGLSVTRLPLPTALKKIWNVFWYTLVRRTKCLQESLMYSADAEDVIVASVSEFEPDIILYDTIRAGQYRPAITTQKSKHIIYLEDLFSIRYEKMLCAILQYHLEDLNAIGNFGAHVPPLFLKAYNRLPYIRNALLKFERKLVERAEDKSTIMFDRCILINSVETNILRQRAGSRNVLTILPRLDIEEQDSGHRRYDSPSFVFLGSLNLPHNTVSIERFIENTMPLVIAEIPNVRLDIIGRHASEKLTKLVDLYPAHVNILGFVEDLNESLMSYCAMISPLLFGSGIKIKMLDALRAGLPVISTTVGVEGVQVEGTTGVLVTDDLAEFPKLMRQLLDRDTNRMASESNRAIYDAVYSTREVDIDLSVTLLGLSAASPD